MQILANIIALIGGVSVFVALIILGPDRKISKPLFIAGAVISTVWGFIWHHHPIVDLIVGAIVWGGTYYVIYYRRKKI